MGGQNKQFATTYPWGVEGEAANVVLPEAVPGKIVDPREELERELLERFERRLVTLDEILEYLQLGPGESRVLGNTTFFG